MTAFLHAAWAAELDPQSSFNVWPQPAATLAASSHIPFGQLTLGLPLRLGPVADLGVNPSAAVTSKNTPFQYIVVASPGQVSQKHQLSLQQYIRYVSGLCLLKNGLVAHPAVKGWGDLENSAQAPHMERVELPTFDLRQPHGMQIVSK